jgi:aarF domain-containing kinase
MAGIRGAPNATSASSSVPVDDDLPFTEYSDAANSEYWSKRPVSVAKRFLQVGSVLGSWFASGRVFGTEGDSKRVAQRAERLRRILTSLGPAYIKIGQALSSRPDVMPPEFLKELETLQDRLPPFPSHKAFATIEAELGRPISDVFSYISEEPVAAASLGQVYRAVLRRDGADVAVKVQRPGVATSIALDILVLRRLAGVVRKWRKFNTDLPGLLDEWATSLFKELDYTSEAANGTRFKALYSNLEGVYVPYMHADLTTQKVLVMEWVDGERLRSAYAAVDSSGFSSSGEADALGGSRVATERGSMEDDLRLVEVGVRCSLEQLLEHGFYHAGEFFFVNSHSLF